MGLPWNVNASMGGAGVNYQIQRSLRFRNSASAYLNRTPSSASNRTTWTWSSWVKRSNLGAWGALFNSGVLGSVSNFEYITFRSDDTLQWVTYTTSTQANLITTQVFRDPSAWYHIVVAFDSTQATSTNRVKMYVNGVQVTSFGTSTYPSLNYSSFINSNQIHTIGRDYSGDYLDGYMAEVNFIDGQQLTPASFGFNDPVTGVWQPAPFKGTYGTNGFYLPFTDIATTSGSNFGLGRDYSGNANYWNTNNISVTAGTTYDSMIDSPTNFSDGSTYYNRGNYATLNPVSTSSLITSQNGNLNASTNQTASTSYRINSTFGVSSGKWYCELTNTSGASTTMIGVGQGYITNKYPGEDSVSWAYHTSGLLYNNGSTTSTTSASSAGDIVGVAFDVDSGKIWFSVNGTYVGSGNPSAGTNPAFTGLSGTLTQMVRPYGANNADINFGQRSFSYTPPTGFKALNTFNLPLPTIPNGAAYMAATLYTGNGSTQSISNGTNNTLGITFQPDFVWAKTRVVASSNALFDSVRGATKVIVSNSANAGANLSPNGVSAFNSGGFSVTDDSAGNYYVNGASGGTYSGTPPNYVAWQWKGGGTAVTNTSGSISSQVSANPNAGFSVITFTGNGTASQSIGHGLGIAPKLIFVKDTTNAYNWYVYTTATGTNLRFEGLNTTASAISIGNEYTGTSTLISNIPSVASLNTNGATMLVYCWAPVTGYSAIGSYTGNGSTDGPFVYTGFRPRWVMFKKTTAASNWSIIDTSRNSYNVSNLNLKANTSAAEVTGTTTADAYLDILSNGFKLRGNSGDINDATTYIYAAFAENPFNYSRAR